MTEAAVPDFFTTFPFNLGIRLLAPGDITPAEQQRADYQRFTLLGDPLADDLVAEFRQLPPGTGRAMFNQAVDHGIDTVTDPPPALTAFFEHVDAVPYWLDRGKLAHAARATGRTGIWSMLVALPTLALNGGYLASRADKTLIGTGALSVRSMAPRRIAETTLWWTSVTGPGGLDRFGDGFRSLLRVRLMHALVRSGSSRRADWDHDAWDEPVNQTQLAGTLMLFSLANIVGCQALGLSFSARERRSVFHLWRYVGYLMGIHPDLLPVDENDTWRLLWLQADYEFLPDADSRVLSEALFASVGGVLGLGGDDRRSRRLNALVTEFNLAYGRLLLGEKNARTLGMSYRRRYLGLVIATAGVNRLFEVPRRWVPGATRLAEHLGVAVQHRVGERIRMAAEPDLTYSRHDRVSGAQDPADDAVRAASTPVAR